MMVAFFSWLLLCSLAVDVGLKKSDDAFESQSFWGLLVFPKGRVVLEDLCA